MKGWMIALIVLVFVIFLGIIGMVVFSAVWWTAGAPANLQGDRCMVSAPFLCEDAQLTSSSVTLNLRNGAGEEILIDFVELEGCGGYSLDGAEWRVSTDEVFTPRLRCEVPISVDGTFKGEFTVTYRTDGAVFAQTSTGSVSFSQ